MARHYLFTSESVTEGHPDKVCDQISDAVLDAILEQDPNGRVACETTACTGLIHVMGEITTSCYVDIAHIAREVVRDIGYDRGKYGFDCDTCAVVFVLDLFSNGYASYMLYFNAELILQGELWRLVTWMFLPTNGSLFWIFISLSFYYFIGTSIEEYWGTAKFTLFYLACAVLMVVFGMISILWSPLPVVSSGNLNQILFLAFATLYPDALIRVYLILPVKAKWLAALYVLLTLYDLLRSGMWAALFTLPQLLAVWLVYLVFFWDRIGDLLREFGFAVRHQNSHQTIQFKSAVKQQRKKAQQQGYRHKCEVCGRTDTDFPDLQFRYCSKCAGYHCFCEDHIFNHTHFTQ